MMAACFWRGPAPSAFLLDVCCQYFPDGYGPKFTPVAPRWRPSDNTSGTPSVTGDTGSRFPATHGVRLDLAGGRVAWQAPTYINQAIILFCARVLWAMLATGSRAPARQHVWAGGASGASTKPAHIYSVSSGSLGASAGRCPDGARASTQCISHATRPRLHAACRQHRFKSRTWPRKASRSYLGIGRGSAFTEPAGKTG